MYINVDNVDQEKPLLHDGNCWGRVVVTTPRSGLVLLNQTTQPQLRLSTTKEYLSNHIRSG